MHILICPDLASVHTIHAAIDKYIPALDVAAADHAADLDIACGLDIEACLDISLDLDAANEIDIASADADTALNQQMRID